jgi:hypothetical protein
MNKFQMLAIIATAALTAGGCAGLSSSADSPSAQTS